MYIHINFCYVHFYRSKSAPGRELKANSNIRQSPPTAQPQQKKKTLTKVLNVLNIQNVIEKKT